MTTAGTAPPFTRYGGANCETSAFHKILDFHGVQVSEPLLFGVAGGINFMHMPPAPGGGRSFTGGRNGPFPEFTRRMADGVGLRLDVDVTEDPELAWRELRGQLGLGRPVIVYGDLFHLPYFQATRHFGGHAFVVHGHDPDRGTVSVSDRCSRPRTLTLAELAAARGSAHHPFPPRHARLAADWSAAREPAEDDIRGGVRSSCRAMLRPPVPTFGLRGLAAYGAGLDHLVRRSPADDVVAELTGAFVDFELAGTGGSAFRVLFRDFLEEAAARVRDPRLRRAVPLAQDCVDAWDRFLELLVPAWTPLFTELRDTYRERDQRLLDGSEEALERAAGLGARLPGLREGAAAELDPLRDQLGAELRGSVRALVACERALFDELKEV
ncbi:MULTISPECIES: BtrH N-terminal domain-containing protein [Streptomyces]|uniref:BtrH N-terminal domain-containing protein n=1 Tax=Streptomyces lienomycini TaxID=284035 RepID=A0ABV9WRD8_9ACTN|nr:BtrH N-terminal domain-containing protein [Streptomyces lienomycini]